tara:strand:+ start:30 stop:1898 length:1869 start_codon:yes stop_codon:yes gene_type:complete
MANRFPLILDTTDNNKIKELPSGDNLDLTGSGINAVEAITSSSTVTSKDIKITGYTTSERDALTPVRGQFIYNTSSDSFQGYAGSTWQSFQGINYTDLSVTTASASGNGSLSYNNNTGVFTFTPADTVAQSLSLVGNNLAISGGNTISLASLAGVNTFVALNDTPTTLSESANYFVKVNSAGDALELIQDPGYVTGLSFNEITSKPSTLAGYGIGDAQAKLVSGTNIKTINGQSILGTGDIEVITSAGDPFSLSVGADDSTMRQITTGESVKFIGGSGISTSSDVEGNITITLTGGANTGDVNFSGTTIDSGDSSAITFTPAVLMNSDLTVENDLTVNNDINVKGSLNTVGSGTPEIFSDNEIELNAGTRIQATTGPFQMLAITTVQRDALTPANGDIIYNTTDNAFQGRANGSWTSLSGGGGSGDITRVNITAGTGLSGTQDTTTGDHTQTLSVDASQTQITAIGTIATGTWQATAIADGYISSAATWNAKIANVVDDTTPQLGGDLDVNGKTVKYQFNMTNDNTDHYVFTDPGSIWFPTSENDPTLYLRRGEQYLFNNTSGGHPFRIQSTTGTGGTPYNTGVTNNGGTGQVIFKVPMSAPATLYYQCTSHTNMNGTINIV